ncbi:MAG TPA: DUF11 domain-containing protein, partial [Anaerolineales bacterium]|nr:DUF11 domain-containing protein [Anaerolineales bacterium]
MTSRKLLPLTPLLLALLGLFLLAQTLPAYSQGNPAADLVLHKAVTPLTALAPGDAIQYTLTFSNAGVLTATEVLITDTLPSLLTDVTVASNLPITATGHDAWIVGFLPPGAGGTITLTGHVSPALISELTFTNTATITSPITDTQPTNNTSSVVSEVNLPPVVDA